MMKIFCDHCGKEINGVEVNELSCDDCFYDHETKDFVGSGYTLCAKCWDERQQAHINLDREFLNIENEVTKWMKWKTSKYMFRKTNGEWNDKNIEEYDPCEECRILGNDYTFDEEDACVECPYNQFRGDDD